MQLGNGDGQGKVDCRRLWRARRHLQDPFRRHRVSREWMSSRRPFWTCNICGSLSDVPPSEIDREVPSCLSCGSSLRQRAVVAALSLNLFGESIPIDAFPRAPDIRGVGISDWDGYAKRLARRLGYRNTFL